MEDVLTSSDKDFNLDQDLSPDPDLQDLDPDKGVQDLGPDHKGAPNPGAAANLLRQRFILETALKMILKVRKSQKQNCITLPLSL